MSDQNTGEISTNGPEAPEAGAKKRPAIKPWQRRLLLVLGLIVVMVAGLVLPPLINISRYQRRITELISRSFGRPVHLSGVELRLLPLPGFVLHDLSVAEDPAYGFEPVLSARTVVANLRLFALWRGKIEVDRISVDEASLNVVRAADGHWNLESLMVGAAEPALTGKSPAAAGNPSPAESRRKRFPYLQATNTRVNLKNGAVKSPFSLVNTDLSLWQDQPGEWRLRLTAQPLRTDTELSFQADNGTGDVRVEGTLHSAPNLREMPLKLNIEWRDAQLGQLSRLILGSDAGWRGDIVADVQVEGTSEAAQTKARLRATGVRRAEFAPETPLDFDANCGFVYQHSINAYHQVGCDTAIGSGHLHLKADLPGRELLPSATLDVKDLPVQAGLDLLRTVRGGFAPGMEAKGTVNGSLSYAEHQAAAPVPARSATRIHGKKAPAQAAPSNDLQGSLTVENAELRGGQLKEPLKLPKMTWAPALFEAQPGSPGRSAISSRVTISLGAVAAQASTPPPAQPPASSQALQPAGGQAVAQTVAQTMALGLSFSLQGYDASLSGSASTARARELAYAFGLAPLDAADGFNGGTVDFDLAAKGPWIAPEHLTPAVSAAEPSTAEPAAPDTSDALLGSLQVHHTEWQAPYLHRPVELPLATVTLSPASIGLASDFTYGTIKGAITVAEHSRCRTGECVPQVQLRFGTLDGGALETALLGTPERKSLLSPLMDRMRSSETQVWPAVSLGVTADSLVLGPVALHKPAAQLRVAEGKVIVEKFDTELLGGSAHLDGDLESNGDLVNYSVRGAFSQVSPVSLSQLLGENWSGQPLNGTGSVTLSGASSKDLAASAKGTIHFDWKHGSITGAPAQFTRFESWSGDATIEGSKVDLGENKLVNAGHGSQGAGTIPFSGPAKLTISPAAPKK